MANDDSHNHLNVHEGRRARSAARAAEASRVVEAATILALARAARRGSEALDEALLEEKQRFVGGGSKGSAHAQPGTSSTAGHSSTSQSMGSRATGGISARAAASSAGQSQERMLQDMFKASGQLHGRMLQFDMLQHPQTVTCPCTAPIYRRGVSFC